MCLAQEPQRSDAGEVRGPNEAGIGSWKSYEVMAVDISRGVYGPSLDILWVWSISLISVPS